MAWRSLAWCFTLAVVSTSLGCEGTDRRIAYRELRSEDSQVRADAASRLGQARAVEAVPSLVAILDDPDEAVRVTAIRALGQIGDRSAVPALVRRSDDPLSSVRRALCQSLGRLGDPAAVPTLSRLLRDEDETIRLGAARALGSVEGSAGSRTLLSAALRDGSETVRRNATKVLAERRFPEVLPELAAALADPSPSVRAHAAQALEALGDRSTLPALQAALSDPEPRVRGLAAHAVGRIGAGEPEAISALRLRAGMEEDPLVQVDLAWNLAKSGDPAGLRRIRELLLGGGSEEVRAKSAMALGEVGDKTDIALLHRALVGGTGLVRRQVSLAVQKLEKT